MRWPAHGGALRAMVFQGVGQRGGNHIRGRGGADQQPASGVGEFHLGQFSLPPFDGQQPLGQHPFVAAAPGDAGAASQPLHGEQDCPVLVEHVEVGLDPVEVSALVTRV